MVSKLRIVILGGGFGGVKCAKKLEKDLKKYDIEDKCKITLVSENNYLLFTPLIPQVVSGTVQPRNSVVALRSLFDNVEIYENRVTQISPSNNRVYLEKARVQVPTSSLPSNGDHSKNNSENNKNNIQNKKDHNGHEETIENSFYLDYDYLVIALGSKTNFFGMKEVQEKSLSVKTLHDAVLIRERLVRMLELAEKEADTYEKTKLLTFVVVGAGFAGIEVAGELTDFVHDSVKRYSNINKKDIKVVVLEALPSALPEFDEELSKFAVEKLTKKGIKIELNSMVKGYSDTNEVMYEKTISQKKDKNKEEGSTSSLPTADYTIPTYTLIWTAGVKPNDVVVSSELNTDKGGIIVNEYLQVPSQGNGTVFALGDCATVINPKTDKPCPPTAQYAEKQAEVIANNIVSLIRNDTQAKANTGSYEQKDDKKQNATKPQMTKFDYISRGQMAVIGKKTAVASIYGIRLSGLLAWMVWKAVYLAKIPKFKKRMRIGFDWLIDIMFERGVTRLDFVGQDSLYNYKQSQSKTPAKKDNEEKPGQHKEETVQK